MASGSKGVIYAALVGNGLIAITKFAASIFTGSSAMLTEAVHSLVDTGNQGLLLWGLRQAKRPPSEEFPFGHGKEIYFWSFVVAIMIFALGSGISIYEGAKHLYHAWEAGGVWVDYDPTVNYIVLGLATLFEGYALFYAWREFRKYKGELGYFEAVRRGKDPTLFLVLFEDSAAMLGLFIAAIGISIGHLIESPYPDGVASVLIGIVLGLVSLMLARETKGLIIGESVSQEVRLRLRELAEGHAYVERVNELIAIHMGPETVVVTASLELKDGLNTDQIEAAISELNEQMHEAYPERVRRVFIEVESFAMHLRQIEAASGPEPLYTEEGEGG